jgi:hypothetical protein
MSEIRFASMPKCASRTLKELGLLGEVEGRHHSKVTEYPNWQDYDWHIVTRNRDDWLVAWWDECRVTVANMVACLGKDRDVPPDAGLKFETGSFQDDMKRLKTPGSIAFLPARLFVNAWLPSDAVEKYAEVLAAGGDFYTFCQNTIANGIRGKEIPLDELDDFLTARGYTPQHINERSHEDACC